MLFNENVSIEGVFRFDIFTKDGELKESITGVKNFITSTGLSYPTNYAIADCFRFLSFGSGTGQNTILSSINNGWGTTGLSQPLNQFKYIGSRSRFNSFTNTSEYESQSCGFRELTSGVVLSRGWRVPTGNSTFDNNYTFKELMLSPGRPAYTGDGSCGCGGGGNPNGVDCSAVADYYDSINKSICNATGAFTRIIRDVSVQKDDFMTVTYDLSVLYNTGLHTFGITVDNNVPTSTNWTGVVLGYANIINHGIKLINDGVTTSPRTQISNYGFNNEYGESFVPLWGNPLEPTCPATNVVAYFSTDASQFLVNPTGGGAINTGDYFPYNLNGLPFSSGVMKFRAHPSQDTNSNLYNIRTTDGNALYPDKSDFRNNGDVPSDLAYLEDSFPSKPSVGVGLPYTRTRTGIYSFQFFSLDIISHGFVNKPVRSMVLAYTDSSTSDLYPFYDILFSNKTGQIVPTVSTGNFTYPDPSTNYFVLENGATITLSFNYILSSPCDSSVQGC